MSNAQDDSVEGPISEHFVVLAHSDNRLARHGLCMDSMCLYACLANLRGPSRMLGRRNCIPRKLHGFNNNMIVGAADLRAALVKLLHAKGFECDDHSIRVSVLARDEPPTFYLVVPAPSCGAILAEEVSRLTGRPLLSHSAAWLLFDHDAELIVHSLEKSR